jgi:hypothetical protein
MLDAVFGRARIVTESGTESSRTGVGF